MANKTYVALLTGGNDIKWVTGFDPVTHSAVWEADKPAKPIPKKTAEDIAFGLRANGYPAVLITAPDWREFMNEPDWFGVVRWCDDDIRYAMVDCGLAESYEEVDEKELAEVVSYIRRGSGLPDAMIEQGWESIRWLVRSYQWDKNLKGGEANG